MNRSRTITAIFLMVASTIPRGVLAQSTAELSPDELQRLEKGRLVMHPEESADHPQLFGGTSWQKIAVPPEALWEAILDTPHYPHMLPQLAEARLLQDRDEGRLILMHHRQGIINARYRLIMLVRPSSRIAVFYVDPTHSGTLRRGQGYILVQPYGEQDSLITFHIMADVGSGLVAELFRDEIQEWMLRVPQTVKRYVEGPGRPRYLRLALR